MYKFLIIFKIVIITCSLRGQVINFGAGPTFILDKEKVSIHPEAKGDGTGGHDDWILMLQYSHYLKNRKISFSGSYSKYPIYTFFHFYKENEGGSKGWNGTNVKRVDLSVNYHPFPKSKFILQPSFGFGWQKSIPKGVGIIGNDISKGIKPDHFELLKDIEADAYSNAQIVPIIGLKIGYAFWHRLELFVIGQQVFGHKKIQELRMNYTYKGIVQPEAISYSDGTGRYYALSLGYRLVKLHKKKRQLIHAI
jgi:hypothetical protein